MKKTMLILFVAIAVLLTAGVLPVYAHGHRGGFRGSIWIGPGWGWGWGWGAPYPYYYPYYYYAAPPVVIPQQPPAYDYEQQAPPTREQPYYWYFCPDAKAYYPYVKQCPGGWKKVVPKPPDRGRE